jgi:hypothetical protein
MFKIYDGKLIMMSLNTLNYIFYNIFLATTSVIFEFFYFLEFWEKRRKIKNKKI